VRMAVAIRATKPPRLLRFAEDIEKVLFLSDPQIQRLRE